MNNQHAYSAPRQLRPAQKTPDPETWRTAACAICGGLFDRMHICCTCKDGVQGSHGGACKHSAVLVRMSMGCSLLARDLREPNRKALLQVPAFASCYNAVLTRVMQTGAYAQSHLHVRMLSKHKNTGMLQGAAGAEGPQRQQPTACSMDQGPASAV